MSSEAEISSSPSAWLGSTVHHYRILDRLGAGGMGEVYAAEDTRLHRKIAIKVLPAGIAADPERLIRFEREARAIAAINHPNVVTIYSVEEAGSVPFLTMELVEGKTLGQLMQPDGFALKDLVRLALPLVDAVAAAHQLGIVHRDLKPANIMVTADGRLKVLDFGLAKLRQPVLDEAQVSEATTEVTRQNSIVGTASYMSPEQAVGQPVDHRSDIFSLGVILYELATGSRPFRGDSPLSIISSILKDEPPSLVNVSNAIPPSLDRIVRRCLSKDPARRYQSAIDLHADLEELGAELEPMRGGGTDTLWPRRFGRVGLVAGLAAITILAAVIAIFFLRTDLRRRNLTAPRMTFSQLTAEPGVEAYPSLSPDGKWVVYAADGAGNRDIYLRSVGGQTAINLTRDCRDEDTQPAFSPDGERIAFRSGREGGGIFIMGRTGEAPKRITRNGFSPAWSPDGRRLAYSTEKVEFMPQNWEGLSVLSTVSVDTGESKQLTTTDAGQPAWSPHGYRIAYMVRAVNPRQMDIWTMPAEGGAAVPLTRDLPTDWNPVWSPDGKFIYFASDRGGSMNLWRIPVEERSGVKRGEPEPIMTPAPFLAQMSISGDGRQLVYTSVIQGQNIEQIAIGEKAAGEPVAVTSGSRPWSSPDPSPDGEWVAFYSRVQPEGDLYVVRSDGTGLRAVTTDAAVDRVPRWSPDGKWIAFFSNRGGTAFQVWKVRPDGSELQQLTNFEDAALPVWSPDGSRIAASSVLTREKLTYLIDPNRPPDRKTAVALPPAPADLSPFVPNSWSPDGQWLAGQIGYTNKGIVVVSLREGRYLRLTDFGEWPVWLPDSRRLLFVTGGKEFHIVDRETGTPTMIFSVIRDVIGPPRLTADGRRAFYSRRVTEADIWLASLSGSDQK